MGATCSDPIRATLGLCACRSPSRCVMRSDHVRDALRPASKASKQLFSGLRPPPRVKMTLERLRWFVVIFKNQCRPRRRPPPRTRHPRPDRPAQRHRSPGRHRRHRDQQGSGHPRPHPRQQIRNHPEKLHAWERASRVERDPKRGKKPNGNGDTPTPPTQPK